MAAKTSFKLFRAKNVDVNTEQAISFMISNISKAKTKAESEGLVEWKLDDSFNTFIVKFKELLEAEIPNMDDFARSYSRVKKYS